MNRIVYTGKVVSTKDPDGLGRVQVKLSRFSEDLKLPWLRLVNTTASKDHGFCFLPEENDEVLLIRGSDDNFDSMYVVGVLYNGTNKPKYSNDDGKNIKKQIRTRAGHELVFVDKDGQESVTLQTGDTKLIIQMTQKDSQIKISSTKLIFLTSDKEIQIKGADKVSVESKAVDIKGSQTVKISGAQEVNIKSDATVNIKGGAKINIESGGTMDVKASGPLTIKGAIVKIN